ncbi:hypothetical protein F8M41_010832 [Gigaspora margarita]|uniref:Zn(2)-C6 fungal-type domain-containing protein n=1 Tax=Gigaspora margarita TaxID=4874 RepID=A0A8H4EQ52_GIGMA|nr:hypothetical protein F8M41_010832 [Gigaspora margarita]
MSFSSQQRRQKQQQRQQRGFYVTRACTNCQKKHLKCSGRASCERCTLRNLECTFIDSGKKRGPKTDAKLVNVSNGSENYFDGTSVLPSIIPNPMQAYASTLSLFGYSQQQPDNIDDATLNSGFYDPEQVYILNNFESDFDGTSMQYSMIPNTVQSHASTLSLSGYPPQQLDNIEEIILYSDFYEKQTAYAFQEADPFSYQLCTNTGYIMRNNNNLIDNTYINNSTVYFTLENMQPWPAP